MSVTPRYIPLRYTATAKYSTFYVFDQIILVDMLMPIVATSFDVRSLLAHFTCIPFYVVSYMCIYEIGYFDNDHKAAPMEQVPVVLIEAQRFLQYRLEPAAWIYAITFAAIGGLMWVMTALETFDRAIAASAVWLVLLAFTRVVFHIYNRLPAGDRIGLYLVLQLLKYGGLLVLFAPTGIGSIVTISQILMMSVIYWIYRAGGKQRSINKELMRLAFATAVGVPFFLSGAAAPHDTRVAVSLSFAWLVLRLSKPPVMAMLRGRAGDGHDAR